MRTDAEQRALALDPDTRPWWKLTWVAAAVLCLIVGFIIQSAQLQLAQRDLRIAVASTAQLAKENRRLARTAAETALHSCKVTQALVNWTRAIGPLEKTVASDSAYHEKRLTAFEDLQAVLIREDGVPCEPAR